MKIQTTVSVAIATVTTEQHRRVQDATHQAEKDLVAKAVLQGAQIAGPIREVDREMGVVEITDEHVYARSVRTMTDNEIAEWLVEHNQGLPPLLLLTFEATVVAVPAHAA